MISGNGHTYRINPSVRTSPLVEGQYRLYFGDRTSSFKIPADEWESILRADSEDSSAEQLYANAHKHCDTVRADYSIEEYIEWLCYNGILLRIETPDSLRETNLGTKQGSRDIRDFNQSDSTGNASLESNLLKNDRKLLLVSFNRLTSRNLLRPPRVLISLQAWLFPLTVVLFLATVFSFYFGAKPLFSLVSHRSNPLTGISRLLIMLVMINFISVMTSICLSYSLGINDQKLYLKLKWGFLPRFAREPNNKEMKHRANKTEELVLASQPLLIRLYLVILSILYLYIYTPIPDSSAYSQLNITVAVIQGSLASMIILLIPVRNTPGRRLLEILGVIPRDYLRISVKRATNTLSQLFKGRFSELSLTRATINSLLFLVALLILFSVKMLILYNILIPNISSEAPQFAGHWTALIVRVALTILLVRFLYLTVVTRIIARRSHEMPGYLSPEVVRKPNALGAPNEPIAGESSGDTSSLLHAAHVVMTGFFRSKILLSLVLVVVFLFPFRAAVTGSANVTEGEALDIRATESATVKEVFQVGPSSKILKKGLKIIELHSSTLSSQRSQQMQLISKLQSEIRTQKTLISSIESGSIKLEAENRTEELDSAHAKVEKIRSTISSLKDQIKIQDDQLLKLRELSRSGAISEFQLQNLLKSQRALTGELEGTKSELKSALADVRVAQRKLKIDQDTNPEEQLSKAANELSSAESSLRAGKIALDALNTRIDKLTLYMPFDGVISSNTRALMNRSVTQGETVVTVKAQPLTQTIALIPEYDRARVRVGLACILRLYSVSDQEFSGTVSSVSPTTIDIDGLQYSELQIQLKESLPTNFIGSKGYAKIDVGYTCILFNLIAPISRFINVDLWSLLP